MSTENHSLHWTPFVKGAFVLTCCIIGGTSLVLPDSGLSSSVSPSSPVPIVAGTLLASLSGMAFWRGVQGKLSASWAVLSFGSWMSFLFTMFAHIVWNARDILLTNGFGFISGLIMLCFIGQRGLQAAWRNEWDRMGQWWLGTLVVLFFLFPQYLYATHFARMRNAPQSKNLRNN